MLKTKPRKAKKRNPSSKDEKEKARQREIADFIAVKGVKKYPYGERIAYRPGLGPKLRERANCELCGSWTDENGEFRHFDWCPTYKKSRKNPIKRLVRKNPIKIKKSDYEYNDLIEVNTKKTSMTRIFLTYQGKEIEFTGKDAEELRDIIQAQLKNFRGSEKLQRDYPKYLDDAGGFNTYITEQLQKVYPKVFK